MDAYEIIASRASIRSYKKDMPSDADLEKIVAVAQKAPNAGAFCTTVVKDADLIAEMDNATWTDMMAMPEDSFGHKRASIPGYRPFYGAPVAIIFSSKEGERLGAVNTACACTAGAYAATSLGLGSCFVMAPIAAYHNIPDLGERLQLPEGYTPDCALLVGYADDPEAFKHPSKQEPATYIG